MTAAAVAAQRAPRSGRISEIGSARNLSPDKTSDYIGVGPAVLDEEGFPDEEGYRNEAGFITGSSSEDG